MIDELIAKHNMQVDENAELESNKEALKAANEELRVRILKLKDIEDLHLDKKKISTDLKELRE